jgi:hypothetical protein
VASPRKALVLWNGFAGRHTSCEAGVDNSKFNRYNYGLILLKMQSRLSYLVHLPKTAGNSVWRQILRKRQEIDDGFAYIASDTYSSSCQLAIDSNPALTHKQVFDQSLSYPAEREDNLPGLVVKSVQNISQRFQTYHDLIVHHHDGRGLANLLSKEQLAVVNDIRGELGFSKAIFENSHLEGWDSSTNTLQFIFTLRDPFERTRSHLSHIKRSTITPSPIVHYEPSLYSRKFDFVTMASQDYGTKHFLADFPELFQYQLRFLASTFISSSFEEEHWMLWEAPVYAIEKALDSIKQMSLVIHAIFLKDKAFDVFGLLNVGEGSCYLEKYGNIDVFEGTRSFSVLQESLKFESTINEPEQLRFEHPLLLQAQGHLER